MANGSINESLFVIDMDDDSESFLPDGEMLPDGIIVEEDGDRGEEFTFYVSADGRFTILAAAPVLAERWVVEGYLKKRALQPHFTNDGDIDCYLLISPSSLVLDRIMDVRVHGSPYLAHSVASAICNTRLKYPEVNLRDGIFCELFGIVLPTFTKTPVVADSCLLRNVLRGQYDVEDIRRPDEFPSYGAGINRMTFNESMTQFGLKPDTIEPYFQVGEPVDDFIKLKESALITGPLVLRHEYQIFATDTDMLLLVLNASWARELVEKGVLLDVDMRSVQIGRELLHILPLSRRLAIEPLNDRHFGVTQKDIFECALALKRSRKKLPTARLNDALYVQEQGLLLPTNFTDGTKSEDFAVMQDITECGPFAQGAFLDDVLEAALDMIR